MPIRARNVDAGLCRRARDTFPCSADLDRDFRERYDLKRVRAYPSMYDDAVRIMNSKDLEVFKLAQETEETRALYGESAFGQGCLLARRLAETMSAR